MYDVWDDAHKQVHQYSGAIHKSFKTLEEAYIWMYHNRVSPPGVRTLFPWVNYTPQPCEAYEQGYLAYWQQRHEPLHHG